jgi:hypothetical protein
MKARRGFATALGLVLILASAPAAAEPLVSRIPVDGAFLVAGPQLGLGVSGERYGVAVGYDLPGRSADAAGSLRLTLYEAESGFGVWTGAAAGIVVPFTKPRVAVEVAPWLGVGWRAEGWLAAVDVAAPAVAALAPGDPLRVPVLVEPWVGIRVGRLWLTTGAGLGEVFVPGELPAVGMRWQVAVGFGPRPDEKSPAD